MKKIFYTAILFSGITVFSQVGINTPTPLTTLEVVGKPTDATVTDGVIAPRITRSQLTAKNALYGTAQQGTIVYVTTIDGVATDDTAEVFSAGYYFHNGVKWNTLSSTTGSGGINQPNTNPVSIESGKINSSIDVGGTNASYPVPSFNGFITGVTFSRSAADGTIITVTMPDQNTVEYNVYVTLQSSVTNSNSANGTNDFTVPVIYNKTPTSFQMFTQETESVVQSVQFSLLLVKNQTPASTPSSFQKGRITSTFDVGGAVVTPAYDGFITGASIATYNSGANGSIITVNMVNQGTTDYDVYTSISSPVSSNSAADISNDFLYPLVFNKTATSFQVYVQETVGNVQQVQLSFLLANGIASPAPANVPTVIYKGTIETTIDVNYSLYPTATYTGFIRQAAYEDFNQGTVVTAYIPTQTDTNYDIYTCLQSGVVTEADIRESVGFRFPFIYNKTTTSFKTYIEEFANKIQQIKLGYLLVR